MVIDWDRFKETFQYYDKEIVVQIIDIFESEFDERFVKMSQNLKDKDLEQLRFNAHSFKGVVSNFMAPEPYALSRQLEEQSKLGDIAGLEEIYAQLLVVSQKLREELLQYKQSL